MGSGGALARIAHQLARPRVQSLRRSSSLVVVFSFVGIAAPAFLFVSSWCRATDQTLWADTPLAGLAHHLAGPLWARASMTFALVCAAFLMLAPAANAALLDAEQQLRKLSEQQAAARAVDASASADSARWRAPSTSRRRPSCRRLCQRGPGDVAGARLRVHDCGAARAERWRAPAEVETLRPDIRLTGPPTLALWIAGRGRRAWSARPCWWSDGDVPSLDAAGADGRARADAQRRRPARQFAGCRSRAGCLRAAVCVRCVAWPGAGASRQRAGRRAQPASAGARAGGIPGGRRSRRRRHDRAAHRHRRGGRARPPSAEPTPSGAAICSRESWRWPSATTGRCGC